MAWRYSLPTSKPFLQMRIAPNNKLHKYVNEYLAHELKQVRSSPIASIDSILSIEERVLIYKYSEDGYESVNSTLLKSKGKINTDYGKLLEKTLLKLPDYKGIVYRNVILSATQLAIYENALAKNLILVEHCFISTSKSPLIANMFGGKYRFTIICKNGKEIERFSKYGVNSGQNEKEVLFTPNCKFEVLEIIKNKDYTLILMEEAGS